MDSILLPHTHIKELHDLATFADGWSPGCSTHFLPSLFFVSLCVYVYLHVCVSSFISCGFIYQGAKHIKLIAPGRTFINSERFTKISGKNIQERQFFLFSDLLLYASPNVVKKSKKQIYQFKGLIPLKMCFVKDLPDTECTCVSEFPPTIKSLTFFFLFFSFLFFFFFFFFCRKLGEMPLKYGGSI